MGSPVLTRGLPLLLAMVVCDSCSNAAKEPPPASSPYCFAVYALSRGKGVPDSARQALEKARTFLEEGKKSGAVLRIQETPIGLEGEKRLSVEFKDDGEFRRAKAKILELITGLELINLKDEPYEKVRAN